MVELHQNAVVLSADGQKVGTAVRIYRNPDEKAIDPERKVFESYLYVFNVDLPERFFIPLEYIEAYDRQTNEIVLNQTLAQLQHDSMTHKPQFIAFGKAVEESLSV